MNLFRNVKERKEVFKRVDADIRQWIEEAAQAFEPAKKMVMEVKFNL